MLFLVASIATRSCRLYQFWSVKFLNPQGPNREIEEEVFFFRVELREFPISH